MNSITFLRAFHPAGPWVLTAIPPEGGQTETKTFGPKSEKSAEAWILKRNQTLNIYFSVNLPNRAVTKKMDREDIHLVPWLHVDVDARAGEDLSQEVERIRVLLTERCPVLPPSVVVFSGGGYQAYWRLAEPVRTNGQLHAAEEMARYNKQLEIQLGGDNCHNIDRIMRVPGTTNFPNAKKRARGRTVSHSEVYSFDSALIYELAQFSPAAPVQIGGVTSEVMPETTSNVARLNSIDDLDKWKVPDRVKVIIVQGFDPDYPKSGDNSRSAWLFDALCQLVRSDVPDDVIYSVVTDPDFGISSSVLDKSPNHAKYAMRQIQRAKEEIEEPWLRRLNERFLVIGNLGGKCRVVEEVFDAAMQRPRMTKQTIADFKNRFMHIYIRVGEKKTMPAGAWWLMHPKRRQFDYLVFRPGNEEPNAYNLWQGFGCNAIAGTKHESYLAHIRDNICGSNEVHYEYLIKWMARAVQKPDSPGETAIVLRGKSGTGKSFFAKQFGMLWGRHFLQVSDAKHLVGAFNAHLRDCVVLFGDEAFFAGDKKHESVLKTLITEEHMMVENKGVDAEVSPNFTHLILASNSDFVVPTGASERRFFVLDVADDHRQDSNYFKAVVDEMRSGGYEALLHYLLSVDLTDFNVRRVPYTMALMEQKMFSMNPFQEWWFVKLSEGSLLAHDEGWKPTVRCHDLLEDYVAHVAKFNVSHRGSQTRLGRFLLSVCPLGYPKRYRGSTSGERAYLYEFPPLAELRSVWESMYGTKMAWPKETVATVQEEAF